MVPTVICKNHCHESKIIKSVNKSKKILLEIQKIRKKNKILLFQVTLDFPRSFSFLNGFPFVVQFLAFTQTNLDLGQSPLTEVDLEWNDGESFFLQLLDDPVDLFFLE